MDEFEQQSRDMKPDSEEASHATGPGTVWARPTMNATTTTKRTSPAYKP